MRFGVEGYLEWTYFHNPAGEALEMNVDEGEERICHIGGLPVRVRSADRSGFFYLLVNNATASTKQGRGVYVSTLNAERDEAHERGALCVFGVCNERSTGPVERGFRAHKVMCLPVKMCVPTRVRTPSVRSEVVDAAFLASDDFAMMSKDVDAYPVDNWTLRWNTEVLRWRLAWPGVQYSVHVSDELLAVSTRTTAKGVPLALIMKMLPRGSPEGRLSAQSIISAACKHHRAPAAIYAGVNRLVPVRGVNLPRRPLPAPLNLMMRSSSPELDQTQTTFDVFECLDFDAF